MYFFFGSLLLYRLKEGESITMHVQRIGSDKEEESFTMCVVYASLYLMGVSHQYYGNYIGFDDIFLL